MLNGESQLPVDPLKDIKFRKADNKSLVYTLDYIKLQFEVVTNLYGEEIEKNPDLDRILNFIQEKGFEEKYTIPELLELVNTLDKKYE